MTDSRSDANDSDKGRDCQRDPAKDPQIRRAELQMFFDADTGKTAKKECRRVMGRDKDGKILANEHGHGNVMSTRGMNPKKKESVPSIMPMGPDKAPMKIGR